MDFGHKAFERLGDLARELNTWANRAYFDPSHYPNARKEVERLAKEISECLKTLP